MVFRLKCLRLVQLLEGGDDSAVLSYFREELSTGDAPESPEILVLREKIFALMALKSGSSVEQEKLEIARSRPELADSLNRSIVRLAGLDARAPRGGAAAAPAVDGVDPGAFEVVGCARAGDLEYVATDSMSSLERLVRFAAALMGTMKRLDDPEVSLAAELGILPESCCAGLIPRGFVPPAPAPAPAAPEG